MDTGLGPKILIASFAILILVGIYVIFWGKPKVNSVVSPATGGASGTTGSPPPLPPPKASTSKVWGFFEKGLICILVLSFFGFVLIEGMKLVKTWDQYSANTPMTMGVATPQKSQARYLNLKAGADWVTFPYKNPNNFNEVLGWKEDDQVEVTVRFEPGGRTVASNRFNLVGAPDGTKSVSFKLASPATGSGQIFIYYQQPLLR